MSRAASIAAGAATLVLLCGGCSSRGPAEPAAQAGSLAQLPAPADMPRGLSETDQWDRICGGWDYLQAPWLYNLIDEYSGLGLMLKPNSGEGAPGSLAQTAFCTFYFNLPDYDNEPRIRLGTSPYSSGSPEIYLGLSNFAANSWAWHSVGADGELALASLGPYIDSHGNLFVVVAASGEQYSELDLEWVIVGGNMAPFAMPVAGPRWGPAPLEVEFSPINDHADPDGYLEYFEWDFDGDGEYDSSYELYSGEWKKSFTYDTPGEYHPVLRVTDNDGATATNTLTISVWEPE